MLIAALFLVLFSNHMEERLRDGKVILHMDCPMIRPKAQQQLQVEDDETQSLLSSSRPS